MKRFFILLSTLFATSTPAHAWWNTPDFEKKEVSAAYRIETKGTDIRVYEWVPTANPSYLCIAVYASTPLGQSCFEMSDMADVRDEGRLSLERVSPENAYKVEALGYDVRVYEWPTQMDPGTSCTASFANAGPTGLTCFPAQ